MSDIGHAYSCVTTARTHFLPLDVLRVSAGAGVPPDAVPQQREVVRWVLALQLLPEAAHLQRSLTMRVADFTATWYFTNLSVRL